MASLSNRVSIDTNVIFLRSMFAFSTNNIPVSTNFILGAGANGQIYAQDTLRNIETYGVGYLPSTFSTINSQIVSTGQQLVSGIVTAEQLTSSQNYLLSTICSVQSNVVGLSTGLSTVMASTFSSYNQQFITLNSSFNGYVVGTSINGSQLNSTTAGILSTTSTNIGVLSNYITVNYVSTGTFSNLSTGVSTQSNYFSVQVVQLSNNFVALSNYTRINLSNQSTQLSYTDSNVANLSSYLNTYSTSVGVRFDSGGGGGGGGVSLVQFQGLSTYVLGQSTTIRQISDSLSTNWSNTSNVSTYVVALSTSVGTRIDGLGGGGVTTAQFQGLSTYVLGQSTTIRQISDSLSTNWSNTSNVSTYVVALSTSVGSRFDSGGGGGGGGTTISTNLTYGFANNIFGSNSLAGGTSNTVGVNNSNSLAVGIGNVINARHAFAANQSNTVGGIGASAFGLNNNCGGTGSLCSGANNTIVGDYTVVGGRLNNAPYAQTAVFGNVNNALATTVFMAGENNIIDYNANKAFIAGGTSNYVGSNTSNSHVSGFFAKSRLLCSLTYASGGMSTIRNAYTGDACGSAQTVCMTLYGVQNRTNTEVSLIYGDSLTSNLYVYQELPSGSRSPSINYFMHTVNLNLTGYQREVATGLTGNGFYYGRYRFHVYYDSTLSRNTYVCDQDGITKATTGGNITLTALETTNLLTDSGGAKTATVKVYITSNASNIQYAITAQSSGTALDWLGQLTIGEVCAPFV